MIVLGGPLAPRRPGLWRLGAIRFGPVGRLLLPKLLPHLLVLGLQFDDASLQDSNPLKQLLGELKQFFSAGRLQSIVHAPKGTTDVNTQPT